MIIPTFITKPGNLLAGIGALVLLIFTAGCNDTGSTADSKNPPTDSSGHIRPVTTPIDEADKKACREAVENLIKYAEAGKSKEAAPLLVYRGMDKNREWKSTCDYARPDDQLYVDKTMAKLQVMTNGMENHSFLEFVTEQEKEGTWYVWIVEMKFEDETSEQKAFAFLKVKGKFALGDID